jgi:hypothetical protein
MGFIDGFAKTPDDYSTLLYRLDNRLILLFVVVIYPPSPGLSQRKVMVGRVASPLAESTNFYSFFTVLYYAIMLA